jgi:HIRAN domain
MNEDVLIPWLRQDASIWVPLLAGLGPAIIAIFKRRPIIRWYLYGLACTVLLWPLVLLPIVHALLLRRRIVSPQKVPPEQRGEQALALFRSLGSYPSSIAQFKLKSPAGIDRRRYAYNHMRPGDMIELVRERANRDDDHAVAYYHRGIHLGYIPEQHRWVAETIDDGHRVIAIVDKIKVGGLLRRRARFVSTRIAVLE